MLALASRSPVMHPMDEWRAYGWLLNGDSVKWEKKESLRTLPLLRKCEILAENIGLADHSAPIS